MDVGDLFQFQCAFQCNRIVDPTAQVKEVAGIGIPCGDLADDLIAVEDRADLVWKCGQFAAQLLESCRIQRSFFPRDFQCNHGEHHQLRRKRFGAGYTNLRTGVRVGSGV